MNAAIARVPELPTLDRSDAAVLAVVLTAGIGDLLATLPIWHLEGNPIALALGPTLWAAIKIVVIAGFVATWYAGAREHSAAEPIAWTVAGFHAAIVFSNLVIAGVVTI